MFSSKKDENKDAGIDMFKFKESGIKVPMPNIEIRESEIPGWEDVNIVKPALNERKKGDFIETEEKIQLIKALEDIKQSELAYQQNSEELALEKKQHAKTIEENNKLRETVTTLSKTIGTLKKNMEELSKQKEEANKITDENTTLLKTQDDFIRELRRRMGTLDSMKERNEQTIQELSRKNELLQKNCDTSRKQLSTLLEELDQMKKKIQEKDESIEKARARIYKLESQVKGNSQSVLYPSRRKEEESLTRRGRETGSKSIIFYKKS